MSRLIKLLVSILLIPLVYSFAHEAYVFLASDVEFDSIKWLVYGLLLYALIYVGILRNIPKLLYVITFLEHLEHEVIHSAVALMFGRGTRKLVANPVKKNDEEETSHVEYLDAYGPDSIISLAPYFFPILTMPLLITEPFVFSPIHEIVDFFIGLTLSFHFVGLLREFGLRQKDIRDTGFMFSICITCLLNIVIFVIALCVVSSNYLNILKYLENSLVRTRDLYRTIYETLKMLNDISGEASDWRQVVAHR